MGVDAMMAVSAPQEITDRQLLRLSYELCSAFGADNFWIQRDGERRGHALTMGPGWLEIETPPFDVTLFSVNLSGRYYGEGYERGSWPLYSNIRRWFQTKLPGCTVFYGGDTSDTIGVLGDEDEARIWQHFVAVQHHPYNSHKGMTRDPLDGRRCEFCDEPMERSGWGGGFAAFHCDGCGLCEETHDCGKTWTVRK